MTSLSSDTGAFFSEADGFTVAAALNGGAELQVLFDNGYQAALSGFTESAVPILVGKTSDLATLVQGSAVTVQSVAYKVTQVHPDGFGISTLTLEKA